MTVVPLRPAAPAAFDERCEAIARFAAQDYFYPGADADDVLQEARLGVAKAMRDWRPAAGSSFDSFATLCARRQVITGLKTALRGKHRPLTDAVSLETPIGDEGGTLAEVLVGPGAPDPVRIVIAREELRALLESARTLTPLEHAAVRRCLIAGEPYAAVGDPKAVDNAIQRARIKLARVPRRLRHRLGEEAA